MSMYSFKNRLKTCLKVMEAGKPIHLKSGHRLLILNGYEEPGFMATRSCTDELVEEEIVFQIGSDTAWLMLIQHVREMTKEEYIKLMFSTVDVKIPGSYDRP